MSADPTPDSSRVISDQKQSTDEKAGPPPIITASQVPQVEAQIVMGNPPATVDGPPATAWKVAMSLVVTVPTCGWFFRMWDKSDFPETFTHPWLWKFSAFIVAFTAFWAWLVRRRGNWFDRYILIILILGTLFLFGASFLIAREALPSDAVYSISLFNFTGDDDRSNNAAKRLRGALLRTLGNLASENPTQFESRERERDPKGGQVLEKIEYLRRWGRRGKTSHLALWVHVGMQGPRYVLAAHYIKVHPFGKEVNKDVLGNSSYWTDTFVAEPVADGISIGDIYCQTNICSKSPALDRIVHNIKFYWGLAQYQKSDYESALHILPQGYANSEYYAGAAAYRKAIAQVGSGSLLAEAERHYLTAIDLHAEQDARKAQFCYALGQLYRARLVSQVTGYADIEANRAIAEFKQSGDIAKQLHLNAVYAQMQVWQARTTYDLYTLYPHKDSITAVRGVADLIDKTLPMLERDSEPYWDATEQLARVYLLEAQLESGPAADSDYQKALDMGEAVLKFYEQGKGDSLGVDDSLRFLGFSSAVYGVHLKDRTVFDRGVKYLEKAIDICRASSIVDSCFKDHLDLARVAAEWADISRERSRTWADELGQAVEQYTLAEKFLSRTEQAKAYAQLKLEKANVYTEWAIGETHGKQEQLLQSAVTELSAGISVLGVFGPEAAELYKARAESYRRLYAYSPNPDPKYNNLAQADEEAAKRCVAHISWKVRKIEIIN